MARSLTKKQNPHFFVDINYFIYWFFITRTKTLNFFSSYGLFSFYSYSVFSKILFLFTFVHFKLYQNRKMFSIPFYTKPMTISSTCFFRTFGTSLQRHTFSEVSRFYNARWKGRPNYGVNVLPSGYMYVVERFGRFNRTETSGLKFMLPLVDKIAYVVETKELCIHISPESAITKDNVSITLGGNVYLQFYDAEKAAYGANNPIYAAVQFAQSAMRSSVGSLELDKLFLERADLNVKIREALSEGVHKWGCNVTRFEITDLDCSDRHIKDSLSKQSIAERNRREKIVDAEAAATEIQKRADAYSYQQQKEAEGNAMRVKTEADANAYAIRVKAEAEKYSIETVATSTQVPGGDNVLRAELTTKYFKALQSLGGKSTTLVVPANLSNVAGLATMAQSLLSQTLHNNSHNSNSK